MKYRNLQYCVEESLQDTPVLFLNGARQTGKSTLVQAIRGRYITFDDATILSAALGDPQGFIESLRGPVILDEVQRAPELMVPLKLAVDRDRTPGRFVLTGSADILLLPRVAESLAGRMEILTLFPFSQGELLGRKEAFLDALFDRAFSPAAGRDEEPLAERMLRGGYPEVAGRSSAGRRQAWFHSYLTTILQRDIREWANIHGLSEIPRLLTLLAARSSGLLNVTEVSRGLGMVMVTLQRYLTLLETAFLVKRVPAWSADWGKRLAKTPKLFLLDTGLMAALLNLDSDRLSREREVFGQMLENFIFMELRKQAAWNRARVSFYHYRCHTGQEVDLILEDGAGRLVAVEVKAAATVTSYDFKGIKDFAESAGKRFVRGVVLYTGSEVVAFGKNLFAVPVGAVWNT